MASPVQNSFGIHTIQVPGSVTLSSAPTAGNVIVALLGVNIDYPNLVIDSTKWKQFDGVGSWRFSEVAAGNFGARVHMVAVYRYIVSGDTAALPAFCTSGTTYWTHAIWEVSGLSGDWAADLLFSLGREETDANSLLPTFPAIANGSLALTSVATYNGTVNPSISGSWTLDFAGANASNYGGLGGASRTMNAGDVIDGQWTSHGLGGANPYSAVCLILTPSAPTRRYPRQHFSTQSDNSPSGAGTPTLHVPWTPVAGNLLVAVLFWNSTPDPTINTTDWSILDTLTHSGANFATVLGRYVQIGDTSPLPNLSSTAGTHHGIEIFEVEGVDGNFTDDVVSIKKGYQDNATPFITTSDTTTQVDALALLAYGERGSTGLPTADSSWGLGTPSENNAALGAVMGWAKFLSNIGDAVQATITPGVSSLQQGYIQILFGGSLVTFTPPPFLRVD